jgi:hypothetical protein
LKYFQSALLTYIIFSAQVNAAEFGKISLPLGKVEVKSAGSSDWVRAKPKMPLNENDVIRTLAKSRCEITLTGGGKVRIGENSELEITVASVKPMTKDFSANLNKGSVWVAAKAAFGEKKRVAVRTPTAVAAIRGTKYRATAGEDESAVLVYEGKVDVNAAKNISEKRKEKRKGFTPGSLNPNKPKFTLGPVTEVLGPYEVTLKDWISLVEGMQINVRKDGKYHMFKFDQSLDVENDFVKWNQEMDSQ